MPQNIKIKAIMEANVIIEARRECYSTQQVHSTLTVAQLIMYLENNFDGESKVYLSHDNGYTFGGLHYGGIYEQENEQENEEEL